MQKGALQRSPPKLEMIGDNRGHSHLKVHGHSVLEVENSWAFRPRSIEQKREQFALYIPTSIEQKREHFALYIYIYIYIYEISRAFCLTSHPMSAVWYLWGRCATSRSYWKTCIELDVGPLRGRSQYQVETVNKRIELEVDNFRCASLFLDDLKFI